MSKWPAGAGHEQVAMVAESDTEYGTRFAEFGARFAEFGARFAEFGDRFVESGARVTESGAGHEQAASRSRA